VKEQWKHGEILKQKGSMPKGAGPLSYIIYGSQELMTKLSTPIGAFVLSCEPLLTDPTTRDSLTKEELDILQTCIQRLTERFFNQPRDEMSPGLPGIVSPKVLPHGSGGPVE
jgi:hypothetical protein